MQLIKDAPLTVYAIIMPRPTAELAKRPGHIRPHYRFLLQRIQLHVEENCPQASEMAVMIFDEEERRSDESLSRAFRNFRFRSEEGRNSDRILENCHFANSLVTPGLEIADFCASVLRQAEQNNLHAKQLREIQDPYLFAIKEFAAVIKRKTKNFTNRYGLYRMATNEWEKWNHLPRKLDLEPTSVTSTDPTATPGDENHEE